MTSQEKTKEELIKELDDLRQKFEELKKSYTECVSEHVLVEESLIEKEEIYRHVFENSPLGKSITGVDGSLFVNKSFCNILGYSEEELKTKKWQELTHPDDVQESLDIIQSLINGTRSDAHYEKRYIHKNGNIIWTDVTTTLQRDKKGTPHYFITSIYDITGRKQLEEDLQRSEERFRIAAETSNDVVYEWDLNQEVMWFGKIDEMLGYAPGEFPRTLDGLGASVHPEDWVRVMAAVQAHLEVGTPYAEDYRAIMKDGTFRWWSARGAVARMPDGKPVRWIGTVTDITDRRHMEDALRDTELKFRTIFDKASDGIILAEKESGIFYLANDKFCEMLNFSRDEITKIGISEIHLKQDLPNVIEQFERMARNETDIAKDIPVKRKDGGVFYADITSNSVNLGGKDYLIGVFRDITERKNREETLRETHEYLENLFNYANAPIIVWDTYFNITRFNPAFEMLTGRKAVDVIGTSIEILFPPELVEKSMEFIRKATEGDRWEIIEIEILHIDGTIRTVLWNSAFMLGTDGKTIIATIAQGQDITERKLAEQALQVAKENLELSVLERTDELLKSKKILDETGRLARVGGWEIDLKKNVLSFSDVTKQIHEVGPEYQPTLEAALNFYSPEAVPVISKAVQCAIDEGEPYDVELQLITAKQNRIWVRAIGQAYRENGEIVKIGGVFQDINERKLAEIEVRKKSEQLQLLSNELEIIIDSIPGLVFYKDTNNRFIRVNKYISDAYNMSKKQLEGVNLDELHTKEQAQVYYEADLQVIQSRQSKINIDEPWETETGTRWVSTSKIPYIDETGEVIGVIGVSLDVTERKLAEEELNKYREHLEDLIKERTAELDDAVGNLQRSNKELEQFAYVASHDLQEPLRMVSSFTQLLERRYKDKLDADANEFIQFAVDGANRMQRLINDLLDYSRITSRGKDFNEVESSQLLGQAVSNLHQLITENTAMVTNEDLPVLKVDESQLVRVFQNLIENAIKYKKKTELPKVHISCKNQIEFYEFAVRDNGIGIDKQFHDRIFIIFQRLHAKEEYPGTGIGLAICKRIIERHGGKIWFDSKPNEGTTFFFTLKKEAKEAIMDLK
jgi:PAS domain S-box-containing protein